MALAAREDLRATYPDEMIAAQVDTATIAAILVVVLLLKAHSPHSGRRTPGAPVMQFGQS
jgi:hypothetical protein